jgi:hypothetical protein
MTCRCVEQSAQEESYCCTYWDSLCAIILRCIRLFGRLFVICTGGGRVHVRLCLWKNDVHNGIAYASKVSSENLMPCLAPEASQSFFTDSERAAPDRRKRDRGTIDIVDQTERPKYTNKYKSGQSVFYLNSNRDTQSGKQTSVRIQPQLSRYERGKVRRRNIRKGTIEIRVSKHNAFRDIQNDIVHQKAVEIAEELPLFDRSASRFIQ